MSFLDSEYPEVATFKDRLTEYIRNAESGRYPVLRRGNRPAVDQILKMKIERAAIDAAAGYYGDLGYDVKSVESEHVGYDLEARHESETLLIEVKGTSHCPDGATVNLSPNEYKMSKVRKRQYRICIVTDALTNREVHDFIWDSEVDAWRDENTGKRLALEEVVSADLTIE